MAGFRSLSDHDLALITGPIGGELVLIYDDLAQESVNLVW